MAKKKKQEPEYVSPYDEKVKCERCEATPAAHFEGQSLCDQCVCDDAFEQWNRFTD